MTTYKTDSMGKYIPASQRPDGTWRKARRVKEGYVPQEEVPLYESKGKMFAKTKSTLPPGMCPIVVEEARKEREKQEKAKAKREAAAAAAEASSNCGKVSSGQPAGGAVPKKNKSQDPASKNSKNNKIKVSNNINELAEQVENDLKIKADCEPPQDLAKQLKKFKKKLREIESLEEKLKTRELKNPDREQMDKIKKKKDIIAEISRIELLVDDSPDN